MGKIEHLEAFNEIVFAFNREAITAKEKINTFNNFSYL